METMVTTTVHIVFVFDVSICIHERDRKKSRACAFIRYFFNEEKPTEMEQIKLCRSSELRNSNESFVSLCR